MLCMNETSPAGQIPVHILTSLANKYPCIRASFVSLSVCCVKAALGSKRTWLTLTSIHKFPDSRHWINCLEQWVLRVFRFHERYISGENSQARKRETTQCNTAKLTQPRPNMAAPMQQDTAREKRGNMSCERPVTQIDTHVTLTREYDTVFIISLVSTQCHQRMRWQIDPDKFSWSHATKTRFSVIWTWTNQLSTTG